jgi:ubiquitin-conjugating enzyme E2 G2
MASSTAQRRLLQEYRALTNNPPEGITAGPVSEDDLLYWEALIQGPEGTPFEGGIFPAELKFPKDYPLAPPSMRFLGEVWHPNGKFISFSGLPASGFTPPSPPWDLRPHAE